MSKNPLMDVFDELSDQEVLRLADVIHEARCGPVLWRGSEQVEWSSDHREWDIATAKAMQLLGVHLASPADPAPREPA